MIDSVPTRYTICYSVVYRNLCIGLWMLLVVPTVSSAAPIFKMTLSEPGVYGIRYEDLGDCGTGVETARGRPACAPARQGNRFPSGSKMAAMVSSVRVIGLSLSASIWLEKSPIITNSRLIMSMFCGWTNRIQPGLQAGRRDNTLPSNTPSRPLYVHHHSEEDRLLMRFKPQGDIMQELWYWAKLTNIDPEPFQYELPLRASLTDTTQAVSVRLAFRGWSYSKRHAKATPAMADHRVEVSLNGRLIGSGEWNAQEAYQLSIRVPPELIHPDQNTLSVQVPTRVLPPADDAPSAPTDPLVDVSLLNWIKVHYPRSLHQLEAGQTHMELLPSTQPVQLVTQAPLPLTVYTHHGSRLDATSIHQTHRGESQTHRFLVPTDTPSLYAVVGQHLKTPLSLTLDQPSDLSNRANQADYIMLSHPRLIAAIQPLAAFHRQRGLRVSVVDIRDVYDEFNHGILHPRAIRDFLRHTLSYWTPPAPRFVLLVGDASWDSKNHQAVDANYPDWTYHTHHQTHFIQECQLSLPRASRTQPSQLAPNGELPLP